jgi:tellurite resistance-related uncharacterized protein
MGASSSARRRSCIASRAHGSLRCDRLELPEHLHLVSQTPELTEDSIPPGLREHTTTAGVWGRIVLTEGRLGYEVPGLCVFVELTPEAPGVIAPEAPYHVVVRGPVRFSVALLEVPDARPLR